MFEKVNPGHPDKVADRIAGAVVDLCYTKNKNPKVACEVLIGHGECNIQVETSEQISAEDIEAIVERIAGAVRCLSATGSATSKWKRASRSARRTSRPSWSA